MTKTIEVSLVLSEAAAEILLQMPLYGYCNLPPTSARNELANLNLLHQIVPYQWTLTRSGQEVGRRLREMRENGLETERRIKDPPIEIQDPDDFWRTTAVTIVLGTILLVGSAVFFLAFAYCITPH